MKVTKHIRITQMTAIMLTVLFVMAVISKQSFVYASETREKTIFKSRSVSLTFNTSESAENQTQYQLEEGLAATLIRLLVEKNSEYEAVNETVNIPQKYRKVDVRFSASVVNDCAIRRQAIVEMKERIGAEFVQVLTNLNIISVVIVEDKYQIIASEENIVTYRYPTSDVDDEFSFCTDHYLVVSKDNVGWVIEKDYFDESLIVGIYSTDWMEYSNSLCSTHTETAQKESWIIPERSNGISYYNPTAAINYAHLWHTNYNPAFYALPPVSGDPLGIQRYDCANFVSQCLYAGGIPMSSTSVGWFATSTGYGIKWCNAWKFAHYWLDQGVTEYCVAQSGNGMYTCIPGNPVYYLVGEYASPSGHIMIHTAYDSAQIPCLSGHSPSQHNVPITSLATQNWKTLTIKACDHLVYTTFTYNGIQYKRCTSCHAVFRGNVSPFQ